MRLLPYSVAAATLALALGASSLSAFAALGPTRGQSEFDLGVDITDVPRDAKDVHAYMSSLEPETRAAIQGACATFMQYP